MTAAPPLCIVAACGRWLYGPQCTNAALMTHLDTQGCRRGHWRVLLPARARQQRVPHGCTIGFHQHTIAVQVHESLWKWVFVASPEQAGKASAARGAPPAAPAPARIEPEAATVTTPVGAPARPASQKAPHRSIHGLLAAGPRRNPFMDLQFEPMDCAGMQVSKAVKAHPMGIAHIALHPRKPIVV